jgi:hypothetical protein
MANIRVHGDGEEHAARDAGVILSKIKIIQIAYPCEV